MHQLRQRPSGLGRTPKRLREPPSQLLILERPEHDFAHDDAAVADHRQLPLERMRRTALVVAVGPNQEQMLGFRLDEDVLQEIERRSIEPLEIVEEQRQRMLVARKHSDQPTKSHLEASLRDRWWHR